MATGFDYPGVLYICGGIGEEVRWYSVDLESLPEKPTLITEFKPEFGANWTVVDEDIYCSGGHFGGRRSKKLFKYNAKDPNVNWETLPSSRKVFKGSDLNVFSIDKKIYFLAGPNTLVGASKLPRRDYRGQVYDINSGSWNDVLFYDEEKLGKFPYQWSAFNMKEKIVVFYSVFNGTFVTYDVAKDEVHHEIQPPFGNCPDIYGIKLALELLQPIVSGQTLYFFSFDSCLYGYDLNTQKWLWSELDGDLWYASDDISYGFPLLFDLYNGTFLVVVRHKYDEFGIATLAVSKEEDSLNVSVKFRHTLQLDATCTDFLIDGVVIDFDNGMVMLKNDRSSSKKKKKRLKNDPSSSSSIMGKRKSATED